MHTCIPILWWWILQTGGLYLFRSKQNQVPPTFIINTVGKFYHHIHSVLRVNVTNCDTLRACIYRWDSNASKEGRLINLVTKLLPVVLGHLSWRSRVIYNRSKSNCQWWMRYNGIGLCSDEQRWLHMVNNILHWYWWWVNCSTSDSVCGINVHDYMHHTYGWCIKLINNSRMA